MGVSSISGKDYKKNSYGGDGSFADVLINGSKSISLLQDLNTTVSIDVGDVYHYSQGMLINAYSPDYGNELFHYDFQSETLEMIEDICGGSCDSDPTGFYEYNGKVYFSAYHEYNGEELFSFDINSRTVSYLTDIRSGIDGSSPGTFYGYNGLLFFNATTNMGDREPHIFDPVSGVVILLGEINSTASSYPREYVGYNDFVYFIASDGAMNGDEIVEYSISNDEWSFVSNLEPSNTTASARNLIAFNNNLYFLADDMGNLNCGDDLYRMDLQDKQVYCMDIYSGPGSSNPQDMILDSKKNKLYLAANDFDQAQGQEFVSIDISNPASVNIQIVDINDSGDSFPQNLLLASDGWVYMRAYRDDIGEELFRVNTNNMAWEPAANVYGSAADGLSSYPTNITEGPDHIFFIAYDGTYGEEPRAYNKNNGSFHMIEDLNPGPNNFNLYNFIPYGNELYIFGYGMSSKFNRSTIGSSFAPAAPSSDVVATSFQANDVLGNSSSNPEYIFDLPNFIVGQINSPNNKVFIINKNTDQIATYGVDNPYIQVNDGAQEADGKVILSVWSTGLEHPLVFDSSDNSFDLVELDPSFGSNPSAYHVVGGKFYFAAKDAVEGFELFTYDKSRLPLDPPEFRLSNINTGGDSEIENLTVYKNRIFFSASSGGTDNELYYYSESSGVQMVMDLYPGAPGSYPGGSNGFLQYNNMLVFDAQDPAGQKLAMINMDDLSGGFYQFPNLSYLDDPIYTISDGGSLFAMSTAAGYMYYYDESTSSFVQLGIPDDAKTAINNNELYIQQGNDIMKPVAGGLEVGFTDALNNSACETTYMDQLYDYKEILIHRWVDTGDPMNTKICILNKDGSRITDLSSFGINVPDDPDSTIEVMMETEEEIYINIWDDWNQINRIIRYYPKTGLIAFVAIMEQQFRFVKAGSDSLLFCNGNDGLTAHVMTEDEDIDLSQGYACDPFSKLVFDYQRNTIYTGLKGQGLNNVGFEPYKISL
jgi:ELWxxDGT repeat protein